MARSRTLLYGEADSQPRDGSRLDAAQREAEMRHELAQLSPGGWQRGTPAAKATRRAFPPPARVSSPPTLRSALPPAAPAVLQGAPESEEARTARVVLSPTETKPVRIPPAPPPQRPRGSRNTAVLAGSAVGAAVLIGVGAWLVRRAKSNNPVVAPSRRADAVPAKPTSVSMRSGVPAAPGASDPGKGTVSNKASPRATPSPKRAKSRR